MSDYILELKGICKSFPGVKALDQVNLKVRPGTVHALMGENGAGKSTLMKCLFGVYKRDAGDIFFDGDDSNTVFLQHMLVISTVIAITGKAVQLVHQYCVKYPFCAVSDHSLKIRLHLRLPDSLLPEESDAPGA